MSKFSKRISEQLDEIEALEKISPKKQRTINLENVRSHPDSIRKVYPRSRIENLSRSVKSFGITTPIQLDKDNLIIEGNLRREALKFTDKKQLKIVDVEDNVDAIRYNKNVDIRVMQLLADLHHNRLTTYERAEAFRKIIDKKLVGINTKYKLAKYLCVSHNIVCRTMAILEASAETKKLLRSRKLAQETVATVLYRLKKNKRYLEGEIFKFIITYRLNRIEAGNLVAEINNANTATQHIKTHIRMLRGYLIRLRHKRRFFRLNKTQRKEIMQELKELETIRKDVIKALKPR